MRMQYPRALAAAALAVFVGVSCATRVAAAAQQAPPQPPPAPQVEDPTPSSTPAPGAPPSQEGLPPNVAYRTFCGLSVPPPAAEPPAGSTFLFAWEMCWPTQGNASSVEYETYQFYTQVDDRVSRPSQGIWTAWDDSLEQLAIADFKTLMGKTNFLDDMRIEVNDHTFPNGAVGRVVSYVMEERQRVKIVDYRDGTGEPIKLLKRSDIDEKLREANVELRLDSFVDDRAIKRIKTVLDEMAAEKGFTDAVIDHRITAVAGGPKLVNVTFMVSEGPKIKIRNVDFVGNSAFGDGTLERKMKENKPKGILSFITGGGTYKETAFEEDAARVMDYYQRKGYARAEVGQPEIRVLENSKDGKEQWIELRVPVREGPRYRFRALDFDGNTLATDEGLGTLFKMDQGDWYSRKDLVEGIRKVTEVYGARGYMEANPFPMFKYSDEPDPVQQALDALVPELLRAPQDAAVVTTATNGRRPAEPTVDITLRIDEGPQYFVNRITFRGNTTTRDKVIRREMRLVEGDVFNTEALKFSVRRINQLGYFQQIEEQNTTVVDVKKSPIRENAVDVTLNLQEQNRNQLTFGAGVSQYEGVFGQLAFQTANFMGRGESLTVQMTAGDRSQNYQLAFTRPFLFDRNITGGFDVYKRSLDYIGYYTQKSAGGNLIFGFRVADFSQMYLNYSYESVGIRDLNEALIDQSCLIRQDCSIISSVGDLSQLTAAQVEILRRNPFVAESLLLGQGGSRTTSSLIPNFVHNTVDNPIFPNEGKRITLGTRLALLGGNTNYYKPNAEFIFFKRHLARTSVGFRAQAEYIAPVMGTTELPIFERLFLGGEYSVRGFDLRSIGPTIPGSQIVLGGNKSLLFNAEYLISIASQVRLVLFYDAGQVRDVGQKFGWKEDLTELVQPPTPPLFDPFASSSLTAVDAPGVTTRVIGQTSAFKTSTGIELRFFMPVLNVPFRLIYAYNPQRAGVLDNSLRPQKETVFRFAVGTTF
jgi:outer membrane protein insertion porin family